MTSVFKFVFTGLVLAGCTTTSPQSLASRYDAMSTSSLWAEQYLTKSPLELAFIEAELGTRGETSSGLYYLGQKTSSAYGKKLYSRNVDSSADLKNCSDFPSAAVAQQYFLASGGPLSDPHNLDGDGDGLACEWGRTLKRNVSRHQRVTVAPRRSRSTYKSGCYTGPRGGTYTITASGRKNYGGC